MTRLNPIIKREIEIKSRSLTLPVMMTVMNAVLFAVGLAGVSAEILRMRVSYTLNYGAFLEIYAAVIMLQYVLVLFTAPVFTADCIAGERERGTFDLLLTTQLTARDIVFEKFASALVSMSVQIVSGLPAMLVPLMFGGVYIQSTVFIMFVMIIEAAEIMSIGMLASSFCRTSVQSIAVSYAVLAAMTIGPFIISGAAGVFVPDGENELIYLTVIDPLLPIAALLSKQTGEGTELLDVLFRLMGGTPDAGFVKHAALIGIMVQTAISFACILVSVMHIMPRRNPLKNKQKSLLGFVEKDKNRGYNK